jgi:nucleoside-diphosphate-sugar epimerase
MKILIVGGDSFFGIPLIESLLLQSHDLYTVLEDGSKVEAYRQKSLHTIIGKPSENGPWLESVPKDIEVFINAVWPLTEPHSTNNNLEKQEQYMLTTTKNIVYLANKSTGKKIIQLGTIQYYAARGEVPFPERTEPDHTPKGFGKIFNQSIDYLLAQKNISPTVLLTGTFVYTKDEITPHIPVAFNKIAFYIDGGANLLQLTHRDDVTSFIQHLLTKNIQEKIINVTDNKPIRQQDLIKLLARKYNRLGPISIPPITATATIGEPLTLALTESLSAKNDLLKSTGYWLKFPDYQAGFATQTF